VAGRTEWSKKFSEIEARAYVTSVRVVILGYGKVIDFEESNPSTLELRPIHTW